MYAIVRGSADIIKYGNDDAIYLDSNQMYNEIALHKSRMNKTEIVALEDAQEAVSVALQHVFR